MPSIPGSVFQETKFLTSHSLPLQVMEVIDHFIPSHCLMHSVSGDCINPRVGVAASVCLYMVAVGQSLTWVLACVSESLLLL